MSGKRPRVAAERALHDGWTQIIGLDIALDGRGTARREVEHHGDAAAVLPYDAERRLACLVELMRAPLLWRHGLDLHLEAPAGLVEDGEEAEATIRREAEEEVGLRLARVEPVARVHSSPGLSTEAVHLFLAPYGEADRVGEGGGLASEQEDVRVVEMPLAELWGRVESGALTDMKTLALVQALRLRRPDLFV
jgi:nudix-type nucleoside diphosphatase (YffH/AdpP family)